jgi:hypothetical protein
MRFSAKKHSIFLTRTEGIESIQPLNFKGCMLSRASFLFLLFLAAAAVGTGGARPFTVVFPHFLGGGFGRGGVRPFAAVFPHFGRLGSPGRGPVGRFLRTPDVSALTRGLGSRGGGLDARGRPMGGLIAGLLRRLHCRLFPGPVIRLLVRPAVGLVVGSFLGPGFTPVRRPVNRPAFGRPANRAVGRPPVFIIIVPVVVPVVRIIRDAAGHGERGQGHNSDTDK